MIQQTDNITRLPNEWHDCGQAITLPFISWKVLWPSSYPATNYSHLNKFSNSFFMKKSLGECENLLNSIARSIAIHFLFETRNCTKQWFSQLTKPDSGKRFMYPFIDEFVAAESGKTAYSILHTLMSKADCPAEHFHNEAERLIIAARNRISQLLPWEATSRVLLEALQRGIPVNRYSAIIPLYRLGHGHKQKRLWRGYTSHTSHIGTVASTHKHINIQLLRDHGFPVPMQRLAQDFERARKAAGLIGYPVVVKPSNTDCGTAVSTRIMNEKNLYRSFIIAKTHGNVIIEKHIEGHDYRLTVINGKCVSVIKREPPQITGNGVDTIKILIEKMALKRKEDPFLRNFKAASLKDPLVLEALKENNLGPDSIPEKDRVIELRSNANVSTGGSLRIVTSETHPDNLRLAERAASCSGLDFAGVDFITRDISKSWRESGGAICEVNPTPGDVFGMQKNLLDYLFPEKNNGRIPVITVVGNKAQRNKIIDSIFSYTKSKKIVTGSVTQDGASIDTHIISDHHASTAEHLKMVLADQETQFTVVQLTPSNLKYNGLNVGYCSIAIFCTSEEVAQNLIASPFSVLRKADHVLVRPTVEIVIKHLEKLLDR